MGTAEIRASFEQAFVRWLDAANNRSGDAGAYLNAEGELFKTYREIRSSLGESATEQLLRREFREEKAFWYAINLAGWNGAATVPVAAGRVPAPSVIVAAERDYAHASSGNRSEAKAALLSVYDCHVRRAPLPEQALRSFFAARVESLESQAAVAHSAAGSERPPAVSISSATPAIDPQAAARHIALLRERYGTDTGRLTPLACQWNIQRHADGLSFTGEGGAGFVESGRHIDALSESDAGTAAMVDLALLKGWRAINITGGSLRARRVLMEAAIRSGLEPHVSTPEDTRMLAAVRVRLRPPGVSLGQPVPREGKRSSSALLETARGLGRIATTAGAAGFLAAEVLSQTPALTAAASAAAVKVGSATGAALLSPPMVTAVAGVLAYHFLKDRCSDIWNRASRALRLARQLDSGRDPAAPAVDASPTPS